MKKILVVDDELEVVDLLRSYFNKKGIETLTASTAEEALRLMVKEEPSLVLLDMRLGSSSVSGLEVLRKAKAAKVKAQIVVLTAVDDQNVVDMAEGLGASGYLVKPIALDDLEKVALSRLKDR